MPGHPVDDPKLIIVVDALISDGDARENAGKNGYSLHPALHFIEPRLSRTAKSWAEAGAMAPIEWYAALIGIHTGASALLAAAMNDAVPATARQGWLLSPFAGRLGRDTVHIMPEELFVWDAIDAEWLAGMLTPLLDGDGFTLLVHDACMLAVTSSPWDARPVSLARVAGHILPNRHPEGTDGGRMMRLCAEMQMLLASKPSERRRDAGLPDVMGAWLWAPAGLPVEPMARPGVVSDDRMIHACADDAGGVLPVAIMRVSEVEAHLEHRRSPRHWLLAGDGHAVLVDTRALPWLGRKAWQPKSTGAFGELLGRLHHIVGRTAA